MKILCGVSKAADRACVTGCHMVGYTPSKPPARKILLTISSSEL